MSTERTLSAQERECLALIGDPLKILEERSTTKESITRFREQLANNVPPPAKRDQNSPTCNRCHKRRCPTQLFAACCNICHKRLPTNHKQNTTNDAPSIQKPIVNQLQADPRVVVSIDIAPTCTTIKVHAWPPELSTKEKERDTEPVSAVAEDPPSPPRPVPAPPVPAPKPPPAKQPSFVPTPRARGTLPPPQPHTDTPSRPHRVPPPVAQKNSGSTPTPSRPPHKPMHIPLPRVLPAGIRSERTASLPVSDQPPLSAGGGRRLEKDEEEKRRPSLPDARRLSGSQQVAPRSALLCAAKPLSRRRRDMSHSRRWLNEKSTPRTPSQSADANDRAGVGTQRKRRQQQQTPIYRPPSPSWRRNLLQEMAGKDEDDEVFLPTTTDATVVDEGVPTKLRRRHTPKMKSKKMSVASSSSASVSSLTPNATTLWGEWVRANNATKQLPCPYAHLDDEQMLVRCPLLMKEIPEHATTEKVQEHLAKCRANYTGSLLRCPHSTTHWVTKPEFELHRQFLCDIRRDDRADYLFDELSKHCLPSSLPDTTSVPETKPVAIISPIWPQHQQEDRSVDEDLKRKFDVPCVGESQMATQCNSGLPSVRSRRRGRGRGLIGAATNPPPPTHHYNLGGKSQK